MNKNKSESKRPTPEEWSKMLGLKLGQVYFGKQIKTGHEVAQIVRELQKEG